MKTIINYLSIGALFILLGCDLEREDYDKIFPENFYKTEADVKAATTAAYSVFSIDSYSGVVYSHGRDGINIFTEMATDVMDCQWGDNGSWESFHLHSWTANGSIGPFAKFPEYKNISKMRNIILDIERSNVSDGVKTKYIAEVRTLRAWLMFCLYDLFGPIPIASDAMLANPEIEIYEPRLSNEDYIKLVVDEFRLAMKDLPVKSSESGHVNLGVANVMLLKVYMHEKNWLEAEKCARELMKKEYGYGLMDSYYECFSIKTEINKENIWSIECTHDTKVNGWVTHVLAGDYPYPNPNAQAWNGYRMPWAFYHTFEKNDDRLSNIVAEYTNTEGKLINEQNPGASLLKGVMPLKYTVDPKQTGDKSGTDVPIFRFSDVLLSLAECIARQGEITDEAMDYINQVRNRVGLDSYKLEDYTDPNKFFDMLLLERGHELYCEGHRRSDLIRYGKFIDFAKRIPNSQTADYKVLYPIPNSFLIESKGIWKNNPKY